MSERNTPGAPAGSDRPRLALVGTALVLAAAVSLTMLLGDRPLTTHRAPGHGRRRAALAIRDHVIPFQKYGTELFTVPALEQGYDRVYYLTEPARGAGKDALLADARAALAAYDDVDVFLLAHGNRMIDWFAGLDPAERRHLRLVYNTGCANWIQAADWLALGARAYVGHPAHESVSPAFYFYFLRRWIRGYDLAKAVADANQAALRRLAWFGLDDELHRPTARVVGEEGLWLGSE